MVATCFCSRLDFHLCCEVQNLSAILKIMFSFLIVLFYICGTNSCRETSKWFKVHMNGSDKMPPFRFGAICLMDFNRNHGNCYSLPQNHNEGKQSVCLSYPVVSTETVFDLVHTFGLTLRFHKVYRVCVYSHANTKTEIELISFFRLSVCYCSHKL